METIIIPKIKTEILYKAAANDVDITKYIESVRYKDYEKDQSDELEIQINNKDGLFLQELYPRKGAKISARIGYTGETLLKCGTFTVDEISFEDSDSGEYLTLRALAASRWRRR